MKNYEKWTKTLPAAIKKNSNNEKYSSDPNKDNWCYNKDECSDVDYYKQYRQ